MLFSSFIGFLPILTLPLVPWVTALLPLLSSYSALFPLLLLPWLHGVPDLCAPPRSSARPVCRRARRFTEEDRAIWGPGEATLPAPASQLAASTALSLICGNKWGSESRRTDARVSWKNSPLSRLREERIQIPRANPAQLLTTGSQSSESSEHALIYFSPFQLRGVTLSQETPEPEQVGREIPLRPALAKLLGQHDQLSCSQVRVCCPSCACKSRQSACPCWQPSPSLPHTAGSRSNRR